MIDVFICTAAQDDIRMGFAIATAAYWARQPDIHLTLLLPTGEDEAVLYHNWADLNLVPLCALEDFQVERRRYAAFHSKSDIYVISDDDCLPVTEGFVEKGLTNMVRYPQFGLLAGLPTNAPISEWTPNEDYHGYQPFNDGEILEHYAVGGVYFARKGIPAPEPETRKSFDGNYCGMLREAGWPVGYMRNVRHNHLGEGYTTVWR